MNPVDVALQEAINQQGNLLARCMVLAIENAALREQLAKLKKESDGERPPNP